eukprot:m.136442 g.136442  ORF g.136442 m.136442 type:complete len:226 (-) comp23958_c0_seq12:426-1103(-)
MEVELFLRKLVAFNKNVTARDKTFRVVQYSSRYLGWYFKVKRSSIPLAARFHKLEGSLSTGRKMYRLLRFLDHSFSAWAALQTKDSLLRVLMVLDDVNKALRMVFDHVLWFSKVGLYQGAARIFGRLGSLFWLLGLIVSMLKNLLLMSTNLREEKIAKRNRQHKQLGSLQNKRKTITLNMIRDILDLPVPLFALDLLPFVPTGYVGLSGAISSVIGLHQMWTNMP